MLEGGELFFTSDPHFDDETLFTKYNNRNCKTLEEMNEKLIANWNSVVRPQDNIICVGDFSRAFKAKETITPRLNGYKIAVLGNHDHGHPAHSKSKGFGQQEKWISKMMFWGWNEVYLTMEMRLDDGRDGILVRINHLPYLNPNDSSQNHSEYRLVDDGTPLICGHVHRNWKTRFTRNLTPQVNVGVDHHNLTPVHESQVLAYFEHMVSGEYQGPEMKNFDLPERGRRWLV